MTTPMTETMTETVTDPLIGMGPRGIRSAYFDATRRYGCRSYIIYNHHYMPLVYESEAAGYRHLINDVTLWDVACERQVEITGPDAARFVQWLTPRNLGDCAVGQCKYLLLTAEDGGVVNDPVLLRLGENHFWLSVADRDVFLWARALAFTGGFDVTIAEPDVSPLQVQGPKSRAMMRDIFGDWIQELKYYRFREAELAGAPVIVSRTGFSGEVGFEVFLRDHRYGDRVWEALMQAGRPYGIAPAGPSTIRRIEAGILSYGVDVTLDDNPFELGLDRLVDLDGGFDFIGKPALRKIKAEGVGRRLVGVEIHSEPLGAPNGSPWPVTTEAGQSVGKTTSAVYSPRLRKNIGIAMVSMEHTMPGTPLLVAAPQGRATATVVPIPFVDPNKSVPAEP